MHQHLHYRGPRGEEKEKGSKEIFEEITVENFPNIGKESPGWINPRRNTPRHIVIKLTKIKDKEKFLKATREK